MLWEAFLNHPAIRWQPELDPPGKQLLLKAVHELTLGLFIFEQWGKFWEGMTADPELSQADRQALQILATGHVHDWYLSWGFLHKPPER